MLVPRLPTDPDAYRHGHGSSYAPKPRTLKMIGMISGGGRPPPPPPRLPWASHPTHQCKLTLVDSFLRTPSQEFIRYESTQL